MVEKDEIRNFEFWRVELAERLREGDPDVIFTITVQSIIMSLFLKKKARSQKSTRTRRRQKVYCYYVHTVA